MPASGNGSIGSDLFLGAGFWLALLTRRQHKITSRIYRKIEIAYFRSQVPEYLNRVVPARDLSGRIRKSFPDPSEQPSRSSPAPVDELAFNGLQYAKVGRRCLEHAFKLIHGLPDERTLTHKLRLRVDRLPSPAPVT